MRTRKQKIILALKIIVGTFLVLIIAIFVFRNMLLQQTIAKVSVKMERDYNSSFSVKKASFVGLSGLSFSEIILVPKNADTLFNIQKMKTSVNFWRLLVGDIQLGTLEIENGFVLRGPFRHRRFNQRRGEHVAANVLVRVIRRDGFGEADHR